MTTSIAMRHGANFAETLEVVEECDIANLLHSGRDFDRSGASLDQESRGRGPGDAGVDFEVVG
jgi:hypothetical protein